MKVTISWCKSSKLRLMKLASPYIRHRPTTSSQVARCLKLLGILPEIVKRPVESRRISDQSMWNPVDKPLIRLSSVESVTSSKVSVASVYFNTALDVVRGTCNVRAQTSQKGVHPNSSDNFVWSIWQQSKYFDAFSPESLLPKASTTFRHFPRSHIPTLSAQAREHGWWC